MIDIVKVSETPQITVTETGVVTETGSERINDTIKVIGATQR